MGKLKDKEKKQRQLKEAPLLEELGDGDLEVVQVWAAHCQRFFWVELLVGRRRNT